MQGMNKFQFRGETSEFLDSSLFINVIILSYSIFKAAGVCLMLLATCCQDDIVPHVLPFVKENIKHTDWRLRDASIMAFGAILEGPDPTNLKPIVEQAMPMLIELMTDKSVIVKVIESLSQSGRSVYDPRYNRDKEN